MSPNDMNGSSPARDAAGRHSGQAQPVLADAVEMWRFATSVGIAKELKALHRPRPARSLLAASVDWALIAVAAVATSKFGWIALPFALLVIGNRQRALGNLLHDASHWSFDGKRRHSELLANLLFCWPLWVSMAIYRDEHEQAPPVSRRSARAIPTSFTTSAICRAAGSTCGRCRSVRRRCSPEPSSATIGRMDAASLSGVACWWAIVLALIALASSAQEALLFFALWVTAKATVFHAITAFREISDHVGLTPGSLIGFSRNHAFSSVLGEIWFTRITTAITCCII